MMTGDNEFLHFDMATGSIMRYNAATNTQAVFVNSSVLVSICKPSRTDRSAQQVACTVHLAQHSGRTSDFRRRTFPVPRLTAQLTGDHLCG